MKLALTLLSAGAICAAALAGACAAKPAAAEPDCRLGAYVLPDGRAVAVSPTESGALRWRASDGTSGRLSPRPEGGFVHTFGWTDRADPRAAAFDCEAGRMTLGEAVAVRAPLVATDTRFTADDGATLAGRLVMPAGEAPVAVAVMIHGSGDFSSLVYDFRQHLYAAMGVGVFVYDKRGTGGSEGTYTQDFDRLARDGEAAVAEARRLAGARAERVGLSGISQGGWVAPLVALRTPVDFVVAGYALAVSPAEEDASEVELTLRRKGYGPEVLARAREVTDATGEVMASNFRSGFAELAAVKRKYRREPWFRETGGEYTPDLLRYPNLLLRLVGPRRDRGTPWRHDPMPVLQALDVPLLWTLAAEDTEAPPDETRRRLNALQAEGRPILIAEFPDTEHGLMHFEGQARTLTAYAPDAFPLEVEFIRLGRLERAYPRVTVTGSGGG